MAKKFTRKQQAAHSRELAEVLRKLPNRKYDHDLFFSRDDGGGCGTSGCALGWAARKGIGGLYLNGGSPMISETSCAEESSDEVFGAGAYDEIFSTLRPCRDDDEPITARKLSIHRLLARADRLEKEGALMAKKRTSTLYYGKQEQRMEALAFRTFSAGDREFGESLVKMVATNVRNSRSRVKEPQPWLPNKRGTRFAYGERVAR